MGTLEFCRRAVAADALHALPFLTEEGGTQTGPALLVVNQLAACWPQVEVDRGRLALLDLARLRLGNPPVCAGDQRVGVLRSPEGVVPVLVSPCRPREAHGAVREDDGREALRDVVAVGPRDRPFQLAPALRGRDVHGDADRVDGLRSVGIDEDLPRVRARLRDAVGRRRRERDGDGDGAADRNVELGRALAEPRHVRRSALVEARTEHLRIRRRREASGGV